MVDPVVHRADRAESTEPGRDLQTPLDALGVLASQDVMITPSLR